eukprot:s4639_g5.t2
MELRRRAKQTKLLLLAALVLLSWWELCFTTLTGTRRDCVQSTAWRSSVLTGSTVSSTLSGEEHDVWAGTLRGSENWRETAFGEGRQKLKAYYINTDLDDARRSGLESTCAQLDLDCERVMPPKLSSEEVLNCVDSTPLRSFECSLVYAHRGILKQISSGNAAALDDARLNGDVAAESAKEMLQSARQRDFVMAGWCDPSCAHAYLVSPGGAKMLLGRGFARPELPADSMFPAFKDQDVLFPRRCPGGYPGDFGLFCQDRGTPHCKSYSYY